MGMGQEMLEEAMYNDWLAQHDENWPEDFKPITWTSADGKVWLITEMSTDHIINCIAWIKEHFLMTRRETQVMIQVFEDELKSRQKPAKFYSLD